MNQPDLEPYLGEDVMYPKSIGEFLLEYCQDRFLYTVTHPESQLKFLQDIAPVYKWKVAYKVDGEFTDLMLALRRAMWHRGPEYTEPLGYFWTRQGRDAGERFAVTVRAGRRRSGQEPGRW